MYDEAIRVTVKHTDDDEGRNQFEILRHRHIMNILRFHLFLSVAHTIVLRAQSH